MLTTTTKKWVLHPPDPQKDQFCNSGLDIYKSDSILDQDNI